MLIEGTLPGDRNRKDWVECYESARFFTVTGDRLDSTPTSIEPRDAVLTAVYDEFIESVTPVSESADGSTSSGTSDAPVDSAATPKGQRTPSAAGHQLSDAELVERAHNAANGDKFARLWRGNTQGYESQSEADMRCAICWRSGPVATERGSTGCSGNRD